MNRIRRTIITLTIAGLLFPMMNFSTKAIASHMPGPCDIHWAIPWRRHQNVEPIKDIIRCAARRWPVPGGAAKALAVAACESGFRPDADGGSSEGLYQHINRYWPGRYDTFASPWWRLWPSIWNARTQAIVTMRMVNHYRSWSAWSCS